MSATLNQYRDKAIIAVAVAEFWDSVKKATDAAHGGFKAIEESVSPGLVECLAINGIRVYHDPDGTSEEIKKKMGLTNE